MPVEFQVTGYEAAKSAVEKAVHVAKPGGPLDEGITYATIEAHRYAQNVVHVWSGALQSALRMQVQGQRGLVFVDGSVVNPITGDSVASYYVKEHERGGDHAFFERTVMEAGETIMSRAVEIVKGRLP